MSDFKLDPVMAALAHQVAAVLPNTGVIVIGGAVLTCYAFFGRATEDLDFCALAGPEAWQAFADSPGWKPSERLPHRFFHRASRGKVDILPCQPGDESPLVLPDGSVLRRIGMAHLDRAAHPVPGLPENVRFASLAAIALLKIVAWMDRPHARAKDLTDLERLLPAYGGVDDRGIDIWQARTDLDLGLDEAGAFLLGLDMAPIASPAARAVVDAFFTCHEPEDEDAHRDSWIRLLPWWRRGFVETPLLAEVPAGRRP